MYKPVEQADEYDIDWEDYALAFYDRYRIYPSQFVVKDKLSSGSAAVRFDH